MRTKGQSVTNQGACQVGAPERGGPSRSSHNELRENAGGGFVTVQPATSRCCCSGWDSPAPRPSGYGFLAAGELVAAAGGSTRMVVAWNVPATTLCSGSGKATNTLPVIIPPVICPNSSLSA